MSQRAWEQIGIIALKADVYYHQDCPGRAVQITFGSGTTAKQPEFIMREVREVVGNWQFTAAGPITCLSMSSLMTRLGDIKRYAMA